MQAADVPVCPVNGTPLVIPLPAAARQSNLNLRGRAVKAAEPTAAQIRWIPARRMAALPPPSVMAAIVPPVPDGAATVSIPAPG